MMDGGVDVKTIVIERPFPGLLPVSHWPQRIVVEQEMRAVALKAMPKGHKVFKERYYWCWSKKEKAWTCQLTLLTKESKPPLVISSVDHEEALADEAPI
jgi:hypothetical protein